MEGQPEREREHGREEQHRGGDERHITAHDILAGATVPGRLDVRIELRPGPPGGDLEMMRGGPLEPLFAQEKRLVKWLTADERHRVLFLTDPLTALQQSGLEISDEQLEFLRTAHAAHEHASVLPPGAELTSLDVVLGKPIEAHGDDEHPEDEVYG
jgi:hypothetical protein